MTTYCVRCKEPLKVGEDVCFVTQVTEVSKMGFNGVPNLAAHVTCPPTQEIDTPDQKEIDMTDSTVLYFAVDAMNLPPGSVFVLPDGIRTVSWDGSHRLNQRGGPYRCIFNPDVDRLGRILSAPEAQILDVLDQSGIHIAEKDAFMVLDNLDSINTPFA